jgi:hypothetical protein
MAPSRDSLDLEVKAIRVGFIPEETNALILFPRSNGGCNSGRL